jgi:hypothetical protein
VAFTMAVPNVLTDPGAIFWAPVGTTLPGAGVGGVVSGGIFTDSWAAPWVPLGATESGTDFTYNLKTEAVTAAEFLTPLVWRTTDASADIAFTLIDFTLTKMNKVLNNGTLTVVSGTGATQLNQLDPPVAGNESRCMIGWESLDHTVRLVCYQTINSGAIKASFNKAPAKAGLACTFNCEIPQSTGLPFRAWSAGSGRA